MTPSASPHRLSTPDRIGIYIFIALGGPLAAIVIVAGIMRIFEVLLGESISVTASLQGITHEISALSDAPPLELTVNVATFTVASLPQSALITALSAPILTTAMALTVAVSLGVLLRNVLRGRVFTRGNTAALVTAWCAVLLGVTPQPLLQMITATEVFESLGLPIEHTMTFEFSPVIYVGAGLLLAITWHAFSVGTKLQRETEGLI